MEMMLPKHAKAETPAKFAWDKEKEMKLSYTPPSDEYYKERIKTLENRIAELEEELMLTKKNYKKTCADLAAMTVAYERGAESAQTALQKSDDRYNAKIKKKDDEIQMAKEAIYLAALREVSLR